MRCTKSLGHQPVEPLGNGEKYTSELCTKYMWGLEASYSDFSQFFLIYKYLFLALPLILFLYFIVNSFSNSKGKQKPMSSEMSTAFPYL